MQQVEEMLQKEVAELKSYSKVLEEMSKHNKYVKQILSLPKLAVEDLLDTKINGIKDLYMLVFSLHHAFNDDGDYCIIRLGDTAKAGFYKRLKQKAKTKLSKVIHCPNDFYTHRIREGYWFYNKEVISSVVLTQEHLENILQLELDAYNYLKNNKRATNPLSYEHITWSNMQKEVDNYMRKVIDNESKN